jgi:hypothetical protein
MIKEIVHAILPTHRQRTLQQKTSAEADTETSEGIIDTQNVIKQPNRTLDNAKTLKVKIRLGPKSLRVPMSYSFLVFYVCFINVIIMCDVSVNNVNMKTFKETHSVHTMRDKLRPWHAHRYEDKAWHGKSYRKSRASQANGDDEKPDKYSGPDDFNKYYDYYKSKEEVINTTEKPRSPLRYYEYDDSKAVGYPHDLAANPYYVKKTNFNLRPESHQFHKKIVKLGVLLPANPNQVFSLAKVLPILEMAIPAVTNPDGPLPGWKILVDYRDTGCSSVEGPLAAFEFYVNGSTGKTLIFTSNT